MPSIACVYRGVTPHATTARELHLPLASGPTTCLLRLLMVRELLVFNNYVVRNLLVACLCTDHILHPTNCSSLVHYSVTSVAESCAPGSQSTGTGFGTSSATGTAAGANSAPGTGGGFWSGTAVGGILGYLFGSRGNSNTEYYQDAYRQHQRHQPYYSSPWSGGWAGGGSTTYRSSASTSSTPAAAPSSSGTRTASGFGGTKRR